MTTFMNIDIKDRRYKIRDTNFNFVILRIIADF